MRLPSLAVPVHDVAGGLLGGTPAVVGGGNATEQDVVQTLAGSAWHVTGPPAHHPLRPERRPARAAAAGDRRVRRGERARPTILALAGNGSSRPVGNLVHGVRYAATAVSGHTAYVFGGEVLGRELDTVQAVDLATGRTQVVARLPVPLGHAMAATVGGRDPADGRSGGARPADRGDVVVRPAAGRFTRAGRLPTPLSDAGVAAFGHRIWLLGARIPRSPTGS